MKRKFILFFIPLLLSFSAHAAPPILSYGGQVSVDGQPFTGNGEFKFAILNAENNASLWSNDGTSANGSQPSASVGIPVNGGVYSILLGNAAIQGMTGLDPNLFTQNNDTRLRIWFSDGKGFEQLGPDGTFSSVPYALHTNIPNGSIGIEHLSTGVRADLNRTIGKSNLTDQILKYLKPEIVSQPNSQVVMTGDSIRLRPEIQGKYLNYQWLKNGQPINGATNLNFEINDFNGTADNGNYSLIASNEFGSVETLSINLSSFVSLDKTFGGSENEDLVDVLEMKGNGFLLIGTSDSNGTGDQSVATSRIGKDFWIVRTNASGEKLWDKRFGGEGNDICKSGIVLEDGFLLAGYTTSKGTGDHSDSNVPAGINFWLLRIDLQGNKVWDKTFGGDGHDRCTTLLASEDGGFLLSGYSDSNQTGSKDSQGYGDYDYWVVKVDSFGNKVWDKTFGGTARDVCQKAITLPSGGYLLWGESNSTGSGNKPSGNNGLKDGWAVRIDRTGNLLWEKTYGGSISDSGKDLLADPLGGYLLVGESNSSGYGQADFWVIRTDTQGNTLWSKNYGGTAVDHCQGVLVDSDGNYILSGISWSDQTGIKTVSNRGLSDFWVIKIDPSGGIIWDRTYGGIGEEISCHSQILANGQLIHFGSTTSGKSADKTQSSQGMLDYWMILSDHLGLITHDLSTTHEHGGISFSHALTQQQIEMLETVPYQWSDELISNGNMLGTASGFHDIYGWAQTPFTISANQETGSNELLLINKETKSTSFHRIYYSPSNRLAVNDLLFSQVTYLNNINPKNTVVGVGTWGGLRVPVFSGVINTTEGFEDHNDSYKSEFNLFKRETLNTSRPNKLAMDIRGNEVPNGLRIAYWSTRKIYSGDSDGDGYSDTDEIFFEHTDPHSTSQGQAWNIDLNTTVSLDMLWVEPGTFTMGQTGVAGPEHNVTLTKGFYLGKHEITQAQYEAVMTENTEERNATPSEFGGNPNRPVEKVSWHDAIAFCQILTQNEKDAGRLPADWNYTLPTEAQWEYACRAGTTTAYSWGDDINSSHANCNNTIGETSNVGSYPANPWGFFDMHGNVWEWNWDDKRVYSSNNMVDPFGSLTSTHSSERGGDFSRDGSYIKSGFRNNNRKTNSGVTIGFRLALVQVP